jgi:hypothetical protein
MQQTRQVAGREAGRRVDDEAEMFRWQKHLTLIDL